MANKYSKFEQSVVELSEKLPQWDRHNLLRCTQSAISSLFEEAGEICGLISKKRIRKHYWNATPIELEDFKEIRNKFIDEVGDFLWVLVCSVKSLTGNKINIKNIFDEVKDRKCIKNEDSLSLEIILFEMIANIVILEQDLLLNPDLEIDNDNYVNSSKIIVDFNIILSIFKSFLIKLYKEYDINLNDIIEFNMNKLNNRYDEKGQRTDGN